FSIGCTRPVLPFVCTMYVGLPAAPTPAPTPAPTFVVNGTNVTAAPPIVTAPVTYLTQPCVAGFTFSTGSGYCVRIVATSTSQAANPLLSVCKNAFYYALPMTVVTSGAANDVAAMMANIQDTDPVTGLTIRRTASFAWTGGLYSQTMGSGSWLA